MWKQHHGTALSPFLNGTKLVLLTVRVNEALSVVHSIQFLAELFCSLTGNILGLKSRGGRRADGVQMTCGQSVDDLRMTRE